MKSKIEGDNYVILHDGDIYPETMNKAKTDVALANLSAALSNLKDVIEPLYDDDDNMGLLHLVDDAVLSHTDLDCDSGRCWSINTALETIKELQ